MISTCLIGCTRGKGGTSSGRSGASSGSRSRTRKVRSRHCERGSLETAERPNHSLTLDSLLLTVPARAPDNAVLTDEENMAYLRFDYAGLLPLRSNLIEGWDQPYACWTTCRRRHSNSHVVERGLSRRPLAVFYGLGGSNDVEVLFSERSPASAITTPLLLIAACVTGPVIGRQGTLAPGAVFLLLDKKEVVWTVVS